MAWKAGKWERQVLFRNSSEDQPTFAVTRGGSGALFLRARGVRAVPGLPSPAGGFSRRHAEVNQLYVCAARAGCLQCIFMLLRCMCAFF